MKLVLLSGGSGKRLWPLSNDLRSKQFLKVLTGEDSQLESMVQRVWKQLERAGLADDAYIATGRGQAEMIQSQLGMDVPLIIEPERRDTFAAIALAAACLYSREYVDRSEIVAILPVDPYVEDAFFQKVKQLEPAVRNSRADLALIGIQPTYPSEKYGYIVPQPWEEGAGFPGLRKVGRFVEKPREDAARLLIDRQALWNAGVFAFQLGYLIDLLMERGLPVHYEELAGQYRSLPKISFDYEVVEKADNAVVIPYEGNWKDLGTWNTLTEEIREPIIGNGTIDESSTGTHIINELDIPAVVLGASNLIVSISPDGILVADKEASPRVKDWIRHIEQRPMYEERRWGNYRVLDYKKYPGGREVLTKRIFIQAGQNLSYQQHQMRDEVWTIVAGRGLVLLNEKLMEVQTGDVIQIPALFRHSVKAVEDLEMIEIQSGTHLVEEDITRLCLTWEETMAYVMEKAYGS